MTDHPLILEALDRLSVSRLGKSIMRETDKDLILIRKLAEALKAATEPSTDEIAVARNLVNQIGDLYAERIPSPDWVPVRQATNDELDAFVARLLVSFRPAVDRVFLVTAGEYSGYYVSSAWTTREAAEKEAGTWGGVEEWLVNTTEERTVTQWHAWIVRGTGEIRVADRANETNSPSITHVEPLSRWLRTKGGSEWDGHGYGPSPEHARKSLSDALAKAKAEELEKQKGQTDE